MTKTIKRLLPAALAVLLAGCAMQPVDSTTTRYRVALVAKNNRDSEFWDAVFTGAEAAATEYNLQLTITAPDDEEDYAAQNQLIADAVEDGAQAIVFSAIDYEANAASARADTLAMLRTHPEINVLIALNETTAVGAAQAVQQMQRADDLWLAAFDSNIETIDALQTGTVDALIVQNTYGTGYFGVESAYKLLAGQGSSVEKSNITATRTITRENMFAMDKQKVLFPFG